MQKQSLVTSDKKSHTDGEKDKERWCKRYIERAKKERYTERDESEKKRDTVEERGRRHTKRE